MTATVDTPHSQYEATYPQWEIMRDVSAGEDAVKGKGKKYLPELGGQSIEQYKAYKARAAFYNATGRTIDGLTGMVFRKPPVMENADTFADFLEDVTLDGIPFQGFAEMSVDEVLTVGRAGILVEYPQTEPGGNMTAAAADRMNLRPFFSMYKAEAILNWRVGRVGNRTVLTQVRLMETVCEPVEDDEFAVEEVEQIRVLELAGEEGASLKYQQRVFRKTDSKSQWEPFGEPIVPMMSGNAMEYIPFIFLGPRDTSPHVCKPPLLDLAHVNLSHYRTCADLEHGAHFTALPTPYCFGVQEKFVPDTIGPETIWSSPDKDVAVGMLEYNGTGLEALEKRREVKENQMASLGARMLAPDKRMAEAAETASIHRNGEISVLSSLSQAVSIGLTQALQIASEWMGMGDGVDVRLNTDYLPGQMDPQTLTALFHMVQGGRISQQTFFYNLKEGEYVPPERTFEDEQELIEAEAPALGEMMLDVNGQ